MVAACALTHVATIAILQHHAMLEAQVVNAQLNSALNGRIVIEQAKGIISERAGVEMEEAFRRFASTRATTTFGSAAVAHGVVDGTLADDALS